MDGWSPTVPETSLASTVAIEAKRHLEEIRAKEVSFIYTPTTLSLSLLFSSWRPFHLLLLYSCTSNNHSLFYSIILPTKMKTVCGTNTLSAKCTQRTKSASPHPLAFLAKPREAQCKAVNN